VISQKLLPDLTNAAVTSANLQGTLQMKTGINSLARLVGLAFLIVAGAANAQWDLDSAKSSIDFISIKNNSVAELHTFSTLAGSASRDGKVELTISLDSVETLIAIRNERMREMLFETVKFPVATVTTEIAPGLMSAVAEGGTVQTEQLLTLSLHGIEKAMTVPVVISGDSGGNIQVLLARPIIVNAADFGLEAGVAALQAAAGLQAISRAVPVTVHLVFNRAK